MREFVIYIFFRSLCYILDDMFVLWLELVPELLRSLVYPSEHPEKAQKAIVRGGGGIGTGGEGWYEMAAPRLRPIYR